MERKIFKVESDTDTMFDETIFSVYKQELEDRGFKVTELPTVPMTLRELKPPIKRIEIPSYPPTNPLYLRFRILEDKINELIDRLEEHIKEV